MPGMAQGAHRGRPVAAAPCTPGLRPAKSPLHGPFDLSLQASGRAEAASLQNTALSPHPCGLPRPSGNVSAILRPSAPAVSVAQVGKSRTGRRNPLGRVRRSRHPTTSQVSSLISCPAALRLPGVGYMGSGEDPVGRISVAPSGIRRVWRLRCPPRQRCACRAREWDSAEPFAKKHPQPQTTRPVSIANRPFLSASARHVSRGADIPAC